VVLEAHLKRYLVNYWCHNSAAELLGDVVGLAASVPTYQEVREALNLAAREEGVYFLERQLLPVKVSARLL
jgi:hypothetical protein